MFQPQFTSDHSARGATWLPRCMGDPAQIPGADKLSDRRKISPHHDLVSAGCVSHPLGLRSTEQAKPVCKDRLRGGDQQQPASMKSENSSSSCGCTRQRS